MRLGVLIGAAVLFSVSVAAAEPCTPAVQATWGVKPAGAAPEKSDAAPSEPVARARDLLARARILDDQAANDEKASAELAVRMPTLRANAKTARDKADRATPAEREVAVAHAEDLETDLAISEAEVIAKKRSAADNRQTANVLRTRALHVVREGVAETTKDTTSECDPPFRIMPDGRRVYRVECFR